MKVTKKELKDRTFIPYEITITVESEKEHENLKSEVIDVQKAISAMSFKRKFIDTGFIYDLLNNIKNHRK